MRILLCWADISGYMAACWRALSQVPGVELRVIAFQAGGKTFADELMDGIDCRVLLPEERDDAELIRSLTREWKPDILYFSGWFHPPYRSMIFDREFESIPKWIGVDTPWWGTWRQQVGRFALRRLVGRLDRVFVAGERAWQYLRAIGAPESKISRGLYGIDFAAMSVLHEQRVREPGGWPRKFLYVGRYAPEKALEVLTEAYASYRSMVDDPWPLGCCGTGSLATLLDREGITNFGFQQPAQLLGIMRQHGAFVLSSHFDPWPLVIVEAAAAGLPVLCTEACGSAVELVRPYYNGIQVPTGDAKALAEAMVWMHRHHAALPLMGLRGRQLAEAYSAQIWAMRWEEAARKSIARRK